MEHQRASRLARELAKMASNPPHGISVSARADRLDTLDAQIIGPGGSPYAGGLFRLEIGVAARYPFVPPSIRFVTRVYHPNVDDSGRICLDLIKMPPSGGWRPTIGLEGLLVAVRMLLESPNPEDPLMAEIADEFKTARASFVQKAREFTEKYAK